MLTLTVGGTESYDEKANEFVIVGGTELQLEHSLVSLSKWESKYEKPFLGKDQKTGEQVFDYVKCMAVDDETPEELFHSLTDDHFKKINTYLDAKMTATWFAPSTAAPRSSEVITSELIYYWMIQFQIPWEAQYWHLNRLFTLIQVCNAKAAKPKKMSKAEIQRRNRELNEQRKAQLGTTG